MSKPQHAHSFDPALFNAAIKQSFLKLHPRRMLRNPVMALVEAGAACLTTLLFAASFDDPSLGAPLFILAITLWLWTTVLFANFAEALAEGRGKAQADSLRKNRHDLMAQRVVGPAAECRTETVSAATLRKGDLVVVQAGDWIPADGEVLEGAASVDESAVTGESAPVIRESGGDRSAVTGGTRILSDRLVVRVTANPGDSFLDRMISLVEGAKRHKTPNEIALDILLASLSLVFLLVVATLKPYSAFSVAAAGQGTTISLTILVALLVCLIPTTIGGLLSAIGIAGMDRMIRKNVIATSGRAVEAAGDVDVLLLDKTGTITLGDRQATAFIPAPGVTERECAEAALLASLADETPEGRSIVSLAHAKHGLERPAIEDAVFIPFTAQTRMSGVDWVSRCIRKGAGDAIRRFVSDLKGSFPHDTEAAVQRVAKEGGTTAGRCRWRACAGRRGAFRYHQAGYSRALW